MTTTPAHLHLIITGGTIDSYFDRRADTTLLMSESVVRDYLEKSIEPHFTVSQKVVAMKDSRQINDEDRGRILEEILRCGHDRILITHGTYTISNTANFLLQHKSQIADKVIVFTGSFYPLARYGDSDAPFNSGFAIASLFFSQPGVYAAMNGKLFDGDKVKKDTKECRFVAIDAV